MMKAVRGMRDVFGEEMATWQRVEQIFRTVSAAFGYHEFRTPMLEHTELFARGVGEGSDIVGKEMYTFLDRGGDSVTMRPEMTAPIVRAAIEHNILRHQPTSRLWYYGPLFRYERPQKGRYRQFHQFGAELLGSPHPEADAEIIMLAYETLRAVGAKLIEGVALEINTLGTASTREAYREALVQHFVAHRSTLSEDSQRRLDTNPLRILDSKHPDDHSLIADAPALRTYLDDAAHMHLDTVRLLLDAAGIPYTVNDRLVRGLEYYSHTVFEITTTQLGSQNAVCGGGRYDPLFEMVGGTPAPAVGFSIGVERLVLLLEQMEGGLQPPSRAQVAVIALAEEARLPAQLVALRLRRDGVSVITDVQRRSAKAQLNAAVKEQAQYAILLGTDELAAGTAMVKNLATASQETVSVERISPYLQQHLGVKAR
ncbi:MAG: histidine--tRNA ligase [Candidatus Kapaibacteriota bacterium]